MRIKFKQLTEKKRYQIEALNAAGFKQNEIAKIVFVDKSCISREFQRNRMEDGRYCAEYAQAQAMWRKQHADKSIKVTHDLIRLIEQQIRFDLSPEQVSGWLWEVHQIRISHEWIYQYIERDSLNGGDLYTHLRLHHKKRGRKRDSQDNRGQIKDRISIEERPKIVDEKSRLGDLEIDTVIGKNHQGALVTIVDRKSKFTWIKKVDSKHAQGVTTAIIELLKPYAARLHTITADNGKEFAGHKEIAKALGITMYFAHPYSSWERGLNENTNGLIRQYFPKGSSFDEITDEDTEYVMHRLNNRPRKGLNYKTPQQVFFEEYGLEAA